MRCARRVFKTTRERRWIEHYDIEMATALTQVLRRLAVNQFISSRRPAVELEIMPSPFQGPGGSVRRHHLPGTSAQCRQCEPRRVAIAVEHARATRQLT